MTSQSVRLGEIDFTVVRLNERSVLLRPPQQPEDSLALPLLGQRLQQLTVPGLSDVIATGSELCLVFDGDPQTLLPGVSGLDLSHTGQCATREVQLPVCFELEDADDWDEVLRQTGFSRDDYVARFCAADLRVAMFGFLPGFTYLAGLPSELRCRRKVTPAARVPAGSVAVGGPYAGIYSLNSPAGWQVIGRTQATLVDLSRTPPMRLGIGDRLQILPVSQQELENA